MNANPPHFEKYSTAPSPNRDYYGIKVFATQVILYQWKVSHGPHLLPVVRVIKFSELPRDKAAKELIEHVFGSNVLKYLELVASNGSSTLLTLPRKIVEKLVKYLNLKDLTELLRTSPVSSEVFDTDSVWKIIYGQLKGSSKLSSMERDMAANRGFKKLVKDHQARSAAAKAIKSSDDKPKRSQAALARAGKVMRSASINIPKTTLQADDAKDAAGQRATGRKVAKAVKPLVKASPASKERANLPRKSTSEGKPSALASSGKFAEDIDPKEAHRNDRSSIAEMAQAMSKFEFVNDDREKTELLLPRRFLKSSVAESAASEQAGPEELLKSKSMTTQSPKGRFVKRSSHALGDGRVQLAASKPRPGGGRNAAPKSQLGHSSSGAARNEDKSEDSDESGMSFLMKRYLEASSEVANKFSECQRLASATKNSSVQVDMSEEAGRKPLKKMHKYAPFLERSAARKKLC